MDPYDTFNFHDSKNTSSKESANTGYIQSQPSIGVYELDYSLISSDKSSICDFTNPLDGHFSASGCLPSG